MDTARVKTGHPPGVAAPNTFPDFDWVRQNWDRLLEQYGECVILVYEQQVIGTGQTLQEAIDDAERNLPPDVEEVTPITDFLYKRHPFFRVRPHTVSDS